MIIKVALYYFVFGQLAALPTDGVPPLMFYLAGLTFWELFASILKRSSNSFWVNQHIFSKVYFPRMVVPLAAALASFARFAIQFTLFLLIWVFYWVQGQVAPTSMLLVMPVALLIITALALGAGLCIASLTVRFRDFRFVVDTGIQVLFFLTPVVYPLSLAQGQISTVLQFNPMAGLIEILKYGFLGAGSVTWPGLIYAALLAFVLLIIGVRFYHRAARKVVDII